MGIRDSELGRGAARVTPSACVYVCMRVQLSQILIHVCLCRTAATMVEVGKDKRNPDEFAEALDETLGDFAFPDEFVFDVWGAIGDAKVGRL